MMYGDERSHAVISGDTEDKDCKIHKCRMLLFYGAEMQAGGETLVLSF